MHVIWELDYGDCLLSFVHYSTLKALVGDSCCTFLSKPPRQTVVNHLSCGLNPTLNQTFFSFWTFLKHVFPVITIVWAFVLTHAGRYRSHLMFVGNTDTAQQCTKVSTLLWVQRLAQNCAHVCNQAAMHMMSNVNYVHRLHVGIVSIQYTWSQKFSSMPRVELVCINLLHWTVCIIMLCIVYRQKTKVVSVCSYSHMLPCY